MSHLVGRLAGGGSVGDVGRVVGAGRGVRGVGVGGGWARAATRAHEGRTVTVTSPSVNSPYAPYHPPHSISSFSP